MPEFKLILLLLLLLLRFAIAQRHLFTSTAHIAQLSSAKHQLAEALLGFAENETVRLHRVRQFAEALRNSTLTSTDGAAETAMHPVEAFVTIRRMGQEWKLLLGDCGGYTDSVLRSAEVELPTSEDYDGAADALLRLQDVYGISADSMARGHLTARASGAEAKMEPLLLSADDCLHLVFRAFNQSLGLLGMQWIRLLMSDAFSANEQSEKMPAVWDILQNFMLGTSRNKIEAHIELLWRHVKGNVTEFLRHSALIARMEHSLMNTENYRKLCKYGSFPRPSSAELQCRLSVPHPFFTLAPVKEELLNEDPRVLLFYDVLTDAESNRLVQVASPKLQRAWVQSHGYSQVRISKSAFMSDSEDWSIKRANRRLGAVTGLNVTDSDPLQMGNYGIGGQYEPHMDSFGSGVSRSNNRVATVLLYLNDVELGGGTVFPRLGLRVLPVKNGALFWHNLRRNSTDILETVHAGCPVLKGSKWVANKWIYYLGQMCNWSCALEQRF